MTRRHLLSSAVAESASALAAPRNTIRLGGPVFLKDAEPRDIARECRRMGYSAAYCPPAKPDDSARLRAIEEGFRAENVILAEVGVWVNLIDADAAKRKANIAKVTDGLAVAEAVGARCCVDIVGSYNPKHWDGPDRRNMTKECFDAAVENARAIIDAVKPKRARFAYEMMGWAIPDTADSYLRLIKAIDRAGFGVHVDVCNMVNSPERYYNNAALTAECFSKLGRWVCSCHAKDLEWVKEMNVHFLEVIPGRGGIDYPAYLKAVASLPQQPPLMLEHLKTPADYEEGRNFIVKVMKESGLQPA